MTNMGGGGVLTIHKKGGTCFVCPGVSFSPAVTAVSYHSRVNTIFNYYFFVEKALFFQKTLNRHFIDTD